MRTYTILSIVAALTLFIPASAQTAAEMKAAVEFEAAARKAYQSKAYADFLENLENAGRLRRNHPRLIYNRAVAYALNGNVEKALEALTSLANMGLASTIEKDKDLELLGGDPRFKKLVSRFAANRGPIGDSSVAFDLADTALISEGVALDRTTGTFYVSSVHKRKIVAVRKDGTTVDFSRSTDGLWGVLGIKVDEKRRQLWAVTSVVPAMSGFSEDERGRSAIVQYNLDSGRLLNKYVLPPGERHALGDLEIDAAGRVYATDSAAPVVYTIAPGSSSIAELIRSDMFASLQGLVADPTGRSLYVADYSKGIFRIDTGTKRITQVTPTDGVTTLGIDGLYMYGSRLLAIQNGVNPNRVVSFRIRDDRVIGFKTLAAGLPEFVEPTLGVLSGDIFYYIANSQWPLVNEKGELDHARLKRPMVMKIDLKRALAGK